ncbi:MULTISPECIES: DAK2 domain-containing protein [Lysinibacillus]|uniref:DAK2 domain-containing protein n=1 Tax=Lysinibacillus TaxID=400634 RepID=UPI0021A9501C|nr:DAK2 domain-containing protein [Lysinibacillus capsici]MCT1541297.1 DAK2 domain-containing protein [Lysinibacillus capsici]MCT1572534.1 DAK2 domain-containing protein [Lysinibacillus capsici]MCT1649699.1 DAK2 domain-containing protein [Lysinibacillus capsici]MCT1728271.1 DAK2 domain-containing protein [Lysinibacillus capsici]MCT1785953.1 DAK2 domain-containing protein [Lysinibacillus capsici]
MQSLDGIKFAEMVQMGAHHLYQNANYVDSLNVFPVPDGDTGTNMNLSMTSGAKETEHAASEHIGKTAQALSKGLLMGARGNSGVILSQLFRGFGKFIEKESTIDAKGFAGAFQAGVDTAYKAVMKPVEGTILTVAREAAKKGVEVAETENDIIAVMEAFTAEAKASLDRTPDLLPVLKEVGVVDSGGQGLLFVYEGFLASLKGEALPEKNDATLDDLINAEHHRAQDFMNTADIEFGYCTEIMVRLEEGKEPFNEEQFRNELNPLGDSLLVISDEEIAKVHIHSEQPGSVLSIGQKYGSLIKIKVDNMREQHSAIVGEEHKAPTPAKKVEKHPYAIVTIAMGEGVAELLRSIGASYVIEGGQTMNPSTEDIVKAVQEIGAEKVLILPNNKNIVMAAEQAVELLEIDAAVVPTKTIPQGMAAILAFNPEAAVDVNKKTMSEALTNVKTGQVTYAVRDTSIDGVEIHKDDFMALAEGKIVLSTPALKDAAEKVIKDLVNEDAEIVTVIYGEDTTEQAASELVAFIEENYPDVEVELFDGKQGLYPYIISVE